MDKDGEARRIYQKKNKNFMLIESALPGVYIIAMYKDNFLSLFAREALMQKLTTKELTELSEGADDELAMLANRILQERKSLRKPSHRLNYPIQEVLDDYVNHRTGKFAEAKRQLHKRFDGQDHDMQEQIMLTFMELGKLQERNFVYEKLYGDDFWVDAYIPLVQAWWEEFHDPKMAKVVVKRCPKGYLLKHFEELKKCGVHITQFEGSHAVLETVREYLLNNGKVIAETIYAVPEVRQMMTQLGQMGMISDIIALDAFDLRTCAIPRDEWAGAVIEEIENELSGSSYKQLLTNTQ